MKKGFIVAIDGPVASGKGTISPVIAEKLHGFYFYTGAMYRCLALYCLQEKVNPLNINHVLTLANSIVMNFNGTSILLFGIDVTDRIKQRDVAMLSSELASIESVRALMNVRQQTIAYEKVSEGLSVVVEGRDIGTTIFPNAECKIFLTATPEIRAKRRYAQMRALGNTSASYDDILHDTIERDKRDSMRTVSPLVTNPEDHGYRIVNDTDHTQGETIEAILTILHEKRLYDSH